ncbi:acyltransferase family protein [Chloroflexota bacterium]
MKERRYDIDWLRVLLTLGIFLFHCARFFDPMDWHLKNAEASSVAAVFVVLFSLWSMPLFFLLSGFGSWYALKSRSGGRFLLERAVRLLVPFYTVGIFLLLPPQLYIDRVSHTAYAPGILDLIPPYYRGTSFQFNFEAPYLTNIWPGHLWFLQFLFLISVLTLPLLLLFCSEFGQRVIGKLAGWCDRWGGIYLFLIPLILVRTGLRSPLSGDYPYTWGDFLEYAVFFLIGYLLAADKRFTASIKKHGWMSLALGLAGFVGVAYMAMEGGYLPVGSESFSRTYVIFHVVWSVASWSWIVFVLSLGAKYLNFNNGQLAYGNEAVLPFYILHQTVILLVGWYIIPLDLSILLKYLVISASSFVLIMLLYELLIKRINGLRFLFGMRLKKKRPAAPVVEEGAQGG